MSCLHYDVIDGDVDEFYKESNESHDCKPDGRGQSDALELCKKPKKLIFSLSHIHFLTDRPFMSGFVHRLTSLMESLAKSCSGLNTCSTWSMAGERHDKHHLSPNKSHAFRKVRVNWKIAE